MYLLWFLLIFLILAAIAGTTVYALSELGVLNNPRPFFKFRIKNSKRSGLKLFVYIAALAFLSRALIIFVSVMGARGTYLPESLKSFWGFFREILIKAGDSPHYIHIAQNWYQASGSAANKIVFYPLYPFCMRILGFFTRDYFVSGLLISLICLVVACYFLYRLVLLDYDEKDAMRSVAFLLVYPFGIFLTGVYTESLFIMLSILVLYYTRQKQWLLVALYGFLASLTRFQGVLLIIPAIYEYFIGKEVFKSEDNSPRTIAGMLRRTGLPVLLILLMPLGFGLYLLCNKLVQGDWFSFYRHITAAPWWQGKDWVGNNLLQHYNLSQEYYSLGIIIYKVQIIEFFAVIGLFFYGLYKKVRISYLMYMLIYLIFCYTSSWLISGARYMLGDVPIFLVLAIASRKAPARALLMLTSILLFVLYSIAFMQGQAIM